MVSPIVLPSSKSPVILSCLLFGERNEDSGITRISRDEREHLLTFANPNHVLVRGLEVAVDVLPDTKWALTALEAERGRITNAISFLHEICGAFQEAGWDVLVLKSLDHWPDLGSDLDLYTTADAQEVFQLMSRRFHARFAPRSSGRSPGAQMELPDTRGYPRRWRFT